MDFSIPLAETAWALMTVSVILAYALRRKAYALFQYSHKVIGIIFYVTAIIHAWSFW